MKPIRNILSIGLLFITLTMSAQKFELGKVTTAELEEKAHPLEPSADDIGLFKYIINGVDNKFNSVLVLK